MEDGETPRMHKYGESKTTQIMMATARHVTSSSELRKFQADGFLFDWVYVTLSLDFKWFRFSREQSCSRWQDKLLELHTIRLLIMFKTGRSSAKSYSTNVPNSYFVRLRLTGRILGTNSLVNYLYYKNGNVSMFKKPSWCCSFEA